MRFYQEGLFRAQVQFLRRQFLQDGELPFTDVLSESSVRQALADSGVVWKDHIYSPLVTLWVFLSQVLSADHSCRAAVARLIAHRLAHGLKACSSRTGAYCQARGRLPEKFFSTVVSQVGRALDSQVAPNWLWNGRRVYVFDGTTVTMPDTPENQEAYPQVYNQPPGLGFPIARIGVLTSLACGAVMELRFCRYAGKGQSEQGMLRRMWDIFRAGDVLLTDRLLCSWMEIATLKSRGVDSVTRMNANRTVDFRRGKRLGKGDHIVQWPKPVRRRSWDRTMYDALPEFLTIRETRVLVERPGFRSRSIIVVTTLLDRNAITNPDLAELYRARWNIELDLRSIKTTMQMDVLRGKTPESVRKEIWTHILAYNLIRTIMAQAASRRGLPPQTISFKATLQTLEAFQPLIDLQGHRDDSFRMTLHHELLDAILNHCVANRPDRFEPRKRKRPFPRVEWLTKPRSELKRLMLKGVRNI